jgi:hypothetical protein
MDDEFEMPFEVANFLQSVLDMGLLDIYDIYALGHIHGNNFDKMLDYVVDYAKGIEAQCIENTRIVESLASIAIENRIIH